MDSLRRASSFIEMSLTLNHFYNQLCRSLSARLDVNCRSLSRFALDCTWKCTWSHQQMTLGGYKDDERRSRIAARRRCEKSIKAQRTHKNTPALTYFSSPFSPPFHIHFAGFILISGCVSVCMYVCACLPLIEFIFMINVFFFPSHRLVVLLFSSSFYPNSFFALALARSPFISYLFIICFTFLSVLFVNSRRGRLWVRWLRSWWNFAKLSSI